MTAALTPLKILVLTNLYPPQVLGGYERSMADIARLLQHRGHQVLVVTANMPEFAASHTSRYPDPPIERCLALLGRWQGGVEWLAPEVIPGLIQQNQAAIAYILQTFKPDVCLAGNLDLLQVETEVLEQVLANQPVAHYVMNKSPGYLVEQTPRTPTFRFITCSDWITQTLQAAGYPTATAQTVYPGADVEAFYQADLPPPDGLRIAYASLVMAYKGTDVLAEALTLLKADGVPFTATIAGGTFHPEFVEALKEYVQAEELPVQFTGALSRQELIELFKTHNVLVFPSRFQEPFGISQIEAMSAGLTLVTSGTGGAAEIVEPGQDGLVFESENPLDLAEVLATLPLDPAGWQTIARRGQQKAMTQFSQLAAVEKIETILAELIRIPQPVPPQPPLLQAGINLHIGGKQRHPDWKILDVESRPEVDIVGNAANLSQLANGSIATIYASHILEHFNYLLNQELLNTLQEWFRVLQPGGQLMVSVPDLKVLCWLYLDPQLNFDDRLYLMRVMFGGQTNEYDVHKVGFDAEILSAYLRQVGFEDCSVVCEFGLFDDSSSRRIKDKLISLNMIATKPC
jgi:glycogen synthase